MGRPTIIDLAAEAQVSVTTVKRVIGGDGKVRPATVQRIRDAAQSIGFYGLGAINNRLSITRKKYRFGALLQQSGRIYYQMLDRELKAASRRVVDADVDFQVEFLEELTPQNVAARMLTLGESCDAIAVVAAVHPLVSHAIETLQQRGVPVFALITQLATKGDANYVGSDNWKVGRTVAWMIHKLCKSPGKLAILVGNHRYRSHDMSESGFRSYFREHAPEFTLLEPLSTFESSAVAQEVTERQLREHPDLLALYVAGGGISGAIAALRATGRAGQIVAVGHQLMENTRAALLDETLTFVIEFPMEPMCDDVISGMIKAVKSRDDNRTFTSMAPFMICTRENI